CVYHLVQSRHAWASAGQLASGLSPFYLRADEPTRIQPCFFRHRSSTVEHRFRKAGVEGSSPPGGSEQKRLTRNVLRPIFICRFGVQELAFLTQCLANLNLTSFRTLSPELRHPREASARVLYPDRGKKRQAHFAGLSYLPRIDRRQ